MSLTYPGTAAFESPDTTTSEVQPRLPNEILTMIGQCCVEPFGITIEDVTEKKLTTEEYPKQFVLTGYPKVKDVALASRSLNIGVKSGLRKKFNGHLTLRSVCVHGVEALDLRSLIALPWLIEQVLDVDEHDQGDLEHLWFESCVDYSMFPHLHTVTKHVYLNGLFLDFNGPARAIYDSGLISRCASLRDRLIEQQHGFGGCWIPDQAGERLYMVFHIQYRDPAVDFVIDVSEHDRPVTIERRIV